MICRRLACTALLAGVVACAAKESRPAQPADVDPQSIWSALWRGDLDGAGAAAEQLGWTARGSVEGERLRQLLEVGKGRRPELMLELQEWARSHPEEPSLQYLQARLYQQPERQIARLEELARRYPAHAWIRLGAAGVAQSQGRWSRARVHLDEAPDWSDAEDFRRIIEARQLTFEGEPEDGLELLEETAFLLGWRDALAEYLSLANRGNLFAAEERARTQMELLALAPDSVALERTELVARRAIAEILYQPGIALDDILVLLDFWSDQARLPAGWQHHPLYTLPIVGALVRPESAGGGPPRYWLRAGAMLLVGESLLRGTELAYLQGARAAEVPWPGSGTPLEIVLADSALTVHNNLVVGGAIFRGFYVRRDLAWAIARDHQQTADNYEVGGEFELPDDPGYPHYLPEDWDLPRRLRAPILAEKDGFELEIIHVAVHEAGHLPEVLDSLPSGPPIGLAATLIFSTIWTGDPLAPLEFRAEARALVAAPEPAWILADIVERTRSAAGTYQMAYTWLLRDLLEEAAQRNLPPLARWHELDSETLRELGRAVCERRSIEPLPQASVDRLLAAVSQLEALDHSDPTFLR